MKKPDWTTMLAQLVSWNIAMLVATLWPLPWWAYVTVTIPAAIILGRMMVAQGRRKKKLEAAKVLRMPLAANLKGGDEYE